jgi:hypothetical protein
MDIEHCGCLSLLLRRRECHEQDGEMLPMAALPQIDTASGDPAMAFDLPLNGRAIIRPVLHVDSDAAAGERRINRYPLPTRERVVYSNAQRRIPSRSISDL